MRLDATALHTMIRRPRITVSALGVSAIIAAIWLLSTEPWGLGVFQLAVFTAPGTLLGLGAAVIGAGALAALVHKLRN